MPNVRAKDDENQPQDEDRWPMSVDEVATLLRVSNQTVRNLCRTGEIEYLTYGRAWRIEPKALEAFLQRKRAEARARAEEARTFEAGL